MSAQNPRNRIVVFRLSQDEFATLKSACAARGGHNLSEFTRSELLALLAERPKGEVLERRLTEMDRKLEDLQSSVRYVAVLLSGSDAAPSGDQGEA